MVLGVSLLRRRAKLSWMIGTGTADNTGHVSTTIKVPTIAEEGTYTLQVFDGHGRKYVDQVTVGNPKENSGDNSGDNSGNNNSGGSTGNTTKDNNTPKMPDLGTGVA